MNQASWERLADAVDVKFGIDKHGNLTRPLEDKPELSEEVNFIQFDRDGQTYRLEHITRPAIIEKKTFHGKSANAGSRVQNIYDPDDLVSKVDFLVKSGDEWSPVDPSDIDLG